MKEEQGPYAIHMGAGVQLISVGYLRDQMGISLPACLGMIAALRIPAFEVDDRVLVSRSAFYMALHAVTRVGQPNFSVSGCEGCQHDLDLEYFGANVECFVREMMAFMRVFKGRVAKNEVATMKQELLGALDRIRRGDEGGKVQTRSD